MARSLSRLRARAGMVLLAAVIGLFPVDAQSLKLVTVNVWSGLDYRGFTKVGTYEPEETQQRRMEILLRELRALDADVIAIQEANPVHEVGPFIAGGLGYDFIAQRTNGGIKAGCLGIPSNLNEGLVVLAKPDLGLALVDVWDVSDSFGLFGNVGSFHFSDRNAALVATIKKEGKVVTIVNVHLASSPPDNEQTSEELARLIKGLPFPQRERHEDEFRQEASVRLHQMKEILRRIKETTPGPVVMLGDFNATFESPEIRLLHEQGFIDAIEVTGGGARPTWDAENPNILHSTTTEENATVHDRLVAWYDTQSRRIDYVFLSPEFRRSDVRSGKVFLTEPEEGLFASDHYGVFTEINLADQVPFESGIADPPVQLEGLPILTYDTDVGFGYGLKAFLLNPLGWSESFDATAFNSTKGERWYRFVFSVPDFELRQGKPYPLSFDLVVDYDKYLHNNFFGLGPASRSADAELYTKEPLELQLVVSRGWSERLVTQIGVKFRTVRNFNYEKTSSFAQALPSVNHGRSQGLTLFSSVRYDSRDSYVNPSRGSVLQADAEIGRDRFLSDYSVQSASLALQTYQVLFYPKTVFAARVFGQIIGGENLPIHAMASLGGNRTLRGYPQDRFLDKEVLVSNLEVRLPIIWRFGGVGFFDAGRVGSVSLLSRGWKTNTGLGLRLLMDTFVVRADLGFSREGTGFYLNFGHVF